MTTMPLAEAVLRTLLYADIFDYPLTPAEIQHYLIETRASRAAVLDALENCAWLAARITHSQGYVTLAGRQAIGALRAEREQA